MTDLPSLITRLREADGPSRQLDNEICNLTDFWPDNVLRDPFYAKPVTKSLDAAVALAERLGFFDWRVEKWAGKSYARAVPDESETATTPAIALLIAILTAWGERQG